MALSSSPSRPMLGAFYMFLTGICFVSMTALIKSMGHSLPSQQIAFLRFAFGVAFFVPMVMRHREQFAFDRSTWGFFVLRGFCHVVGVSLWFYSLSVIPLAEVTAMNYMTPIYVTIGAALIFGERLAWMRIIAIFVAFVGVLVVLRPGFRAVEMGHVAMLVGAVCLAGSYLVAKRLSGQASAGVVVAMMSFTVTVMMAPLAMMVWVTPSPRELILSCGVAALASGAHFFMTLSFKVAPMVVTQPVNFLQLVWAVILGAVMFGEAVDAFVVLGGVVIAGAVCFITWRAAVAGRVSAGAETQA